MGRASTPSASGALDNDKSPIDALIMIYRFPTHELDTERRELRRHGAPVPMPPKVFAVLVHLVQHHDRMVSKIELLDRFWPSNISEAALQTTISQLRKAVGDTRRARSVIRTYHGHGFRFVAPLSIVGGETATPVDDDAETSAEADGPVSAPPLREQRLAAVLCLRLCQTGSDGVPADRRQDTLGEANQRVRQIVESHGGRLLQVVVDGLSTVFGLEQGHEDSARRAVHCAAELALAPVSRLLNAIGLTPSFAVDVGYLDLPSGAERTHWAPPTSTERAAAELAKRAAPGDILLSDAALHHLGDEVACEALESGHRLLAIPRRRAGIPTRQGNRNSQFVGRSAELAFLSARLDLLRDGNGQAIVLSGPPGIGKTRLVSEFLAGLDRDAFRPVVLNCLPRLSNTPLAPVRELCLSLFADPPAEVALDEADAALLNELLEETAAASPLLAGLSDHQRRQRLHALIDRLLWAASRDLPRVIVFEDVHWLDTSSRDILDGLAERIDQRSILLLMTTRSTGEPPHLEALLQLSPLGRNDCVKLLCSLPGCAAQSERDIESLVQRAAGNPFFLEELALIAQSGADPTRELPGTVNAVICDRISGLEHRSRALLYVCAVIGPCALVDLAAHLLGESPEILLADAMGLVRMGFLQEDARGLRFRHMLISDVAYAMLPAAERKRLHREIARYLHARGEQEGVRPEDLAWHYQEAGETDQAISLWSAACRSALRRCAYREGLAFGQAGMALIGSAKEQAETKELELQLSLALALTALHGFGASDVGAAYLRARTLAKQIDCARASYQACAGLWVHTWVLGQLSHSLAHAEELLASSRESDKLVHKAHALAAVGEVRVHQGDLAAGLEHLRKGLELILREPPETIQTQNAAVTCAAYASWVTSLAGAADRADEFVARSEAFSRLLENPFAEATHCGLCADAFLFQDKPAECLALAEQAVEISRAQGFPFWLGTGLIERGWALGRLGDYSAALECIDEGIAVFEATGAGVQLANWYGVKAETLLRAARMRDALAAARHALACAERTSDMFFVPRIHAVAAVAQEALGAPGQASRHQAQARSLAEAFGMTPRIIEIMLPRQPVAQIPL